MQKACVSIYSKIKNRILHVRIRFFIEINLSAVALARIVVETAYEARISSCNE